MNYNILYYKNKGILLNHNIDIDKQIVYAINNFTLERYGLEYE